MLTINTGPRESESKSKDEDNDKLNVVKIITKHQLHAVRWSRILDGSKRVFKKDSLSAAAANVSFLYELLGPSLI